MKQFQVIKERRYDTSPHNGQRGFQEDINEALKEGWEPLGGIYQCCQTGNGTEYFSCLGMVREKPSPTMEIGSRVYFMNGMHYGMHGRIDAIHEGQFTIKGDDTRFYFTSNPDQDLRIIE